MSQPSSEETRDHLAHLSTRVSMAATTVVVQTNRMLITKRYAEMTSTERQIGQLQLSCVKVS